MIHVTTRLTDSEQAFLLSLARQQLTAYLTDADLPHPQVTNKRLSQQAGAFVTLWLPGRQLRGCVGRVEAQTPLYQTVQDCAVAAAVRDFRFNPVSAAELPDLRLEISVLTPLQRITTPDEIEIGRHGLFIKQAFPVPRTGLLLPQVAANRNWDRHQFLEAVCLKAGLPPDNRQSATLYVFESQVFEEDVPPL